MSSVPEQHDSDYPAYWDWDKDGLSVTGKFIRLDEAPSKFGLTPIVVLFLEDGTSRAVWLNRTALKSQFAEELERRGAQDFVVGERITATRGETKREPEGGSAYWPYRTVFHDAPRRSGAAILGADVSDAGDDETTDDDDDGIPF
jgi:hypothetical protein